MSGIFKFRVRITSASSQFLPDVCSYIDMCLYVYSRLNAGRPDVEGSAFVHDFFDEFDWGAMAYRQHPDVPYIPSPEEVELNTKWSGSTISSVLDPEEKFKGDNSLFAQF